jgi:methionyl-tRNA formyltransferase
MAMKIAFFGTPDFTVDFLDTLKKSGFCPSLVITNGDRPVGRGMVLTSPLPKKWADENTVKVLQPEKLNDEIFEELSKESWDLFIVIAYGKIIPEKIINLPKFGTINLHYSLLPKYRGATPVESAILHGEQTSGITIQKMRFRLDTGPIIFQEEVPIEISDTTITLREKMNQRAQEVLPEVIQNIFENKIQEIEQDESLASHCGKISKEDGLISIDDDPTVLDRKWRAYTPWPGLYFFLPAQTGKDGKRIKITKAHLKGGRFVIEEVIPENGKPINFENL